MNVLSLFTGAGGGELAFQHLLTGFRTVGYVEIEEYCQKIIKQRIKDGLLDAVPIFGDIRKFISEGYAETYRGMVDVITAGFPCQPFSVAGKQKAEQDERNMWPATLETICIIRPRFCLLENVPGLLAKSHGYFGTTLQGLAEAGYNARWIVLGADDVGACHKRKRLWILAHTTWKTDVNDKGEYAQRCQAAGFQLGISQAVKLWPTPRQFMHKDAKEDRGKGNLGEKVQGQLNPDWVEWLMGWPIGWTSLEPMTELLWLNWSVDPADMESNMVWPTPTCDDRSGNVSNKKPNQMPMLRRMKDELLRSQGPILRVATGIKDRVNRLKAIGNGQVPQCAALAWEILTT